MFLRNGLAKSSSVRLRERLTLDVKKMYMGCHNVCNSPNGLRSLGCFEQIFCPKTVKKVVCCRDDTLYLLCDDGVYRLKNGAVTPLYQKAIKDVCFTRYNTNVLFSAEDEGVYMQTNGIEPKLLSPGGYRSMLTAQTRVFGLNGSGLWVSSVDPVLNWTNTYSIGVFTDCITLVAVNDKVYMLGDVCYAYDGREYKIDSKLYPIAQGIGAVQKDSAVHLQNSAIFATANGLYRIVGDRVTQLCPELGSLVNFEGAVACAMSGGYLVSCRRREEGGDANDITLLINAEKGQLSGVFEWGFDSLFDCEGDVYGCRDGKLYIFRPKLGQSVFRQQNIDMGTQKIKFLDRLIVRSGCNCEVRVRSDGIVRSYPVYGSRTTRRFPITGKGREFAVEVRSDDGMSLELLELYAHTQREE